MNGNVFFFGVVVFLLEIIVGLELVILEFLLVYLKYKFGLLDVWLRDMECYLNSILS